MSQETAAQDYFDPQDPTPTCDICEEPQHLDCDRSDCEDDWNGETGCHETCEERQKEDENDDNATDRL